MEDKKKRSKGLIITIIILIILVLGLTGYILVDKDVIRLSETTNTEDKSSNKETDNKERPIEYKAIRDELRQKVSNLEEINSIETEGYRSGYIYKKDTTNQDIPNDIKLQLALDSIYSLSAASIVTTDYNFGQLDSQIFRQIYVEDVEDYYYSLFGSKNVNHKDYSGTCPMYIYDSKNNKYYGASECGGTSAIGIVTYINKYSQDDSHAYVYVSLGSINGEYQKIYTDYSQNNEYTKESFDDFTGSNGSEINESNYKDFSQYKYTFNKNSDGSYYFSSIKKINK